MLLFRRITVLLAMAVTICGCSLLSSCGDAETGGENTTGAESTKSVKAANTEATSRISPSDSAQTTDNPTFVRGGTRGAARVKSSLIENTDRAKTLEQFEAAAGPATTEVLAKLEADIQKAPNNPDTYLERCEFLRRADKPDLALLDAEKAIAINPNYIRARRHRAECLELLQREEEAMKDHEFVLKSNPTDKKALLHRGLFYISRNKNKEAVAEFSKVIDAGTGNKAAYQWRAKAHENLGEFDQALEDLELYLAHKPNEEKTVQKHLDLALKLGKWEKALKDTDQMLAHYPRDGTLHMTKGDIYSGLKQYKNAIAEYTIAAEIEPSFAKAFEKRAFAYEKNNQRELAIQDRQRADELKKVRPDHEAQATE